MQKMKSPDSHKVPKHPEQFGTYFLAVLLPSLTIGGLCCKSEAGPGRTNLEEFFQGYLRNQKESGPN
jgi:hypothetical protein